MGAVGHWSTGLTGRPGELRLRNHSSHPGALAHDLHWRGARSSAVAWRCRRPAVHRWTIRGALVQRGVALEEVQRHQASRFSRNVLPSYEVRYGGSSSTTDESWSFLFRMTARGAAC